MLTLGTGIGAGIIFNDKLLPVAAEIGHMSIKADGHQCPCRKCGLPRTLCLGNGDYRQCYCRA